MNTSNRLLPAWVAAALVCVMLIGAVAFAICVLGWPARAWAAFLVSAFYAIGLCLAGAVFLAIRALTAAGWSGLIARVPEAMAGALPLFGACFLPLLLALPQLYHWAHEGAAAHDAVLAAKAPWLNPLGFGARTLAYLAIWCMLARRLAPGTSPGGDVADAWRARVRSAAVFALVFAPTFSLAAVDWLMSVEPHWTSTLYPWYVFSTVFAGGLAALTLIVLGAASRGMLPGLSVHHRHDLGKLVFAFSFFWGYLWFCQYLLIWYANIPEEVTHYLARTTPTWVWAFGANAVINLVVPFLALVSARAKKNTAWLATMCALVVAGHWLDLHLLVMPALFPQGPALAPIDVLVAAGFAAAFVLAVDRQLGAGPAVPQDDPFLAESIAHHGA